MSLCIACIGRRIFLSIFLSISKQKKKLWNVENKNNHFHHNTLLSSISISWRTLGLKKYFNCKTKALLLFSRSIWSATKYCVYNLHNASPQYHFICTYKIFYSNSNIVLYTTGFVMYTSFMEYVLSCVSPLSMMLCT